MNDSFIFIWVFDHLPVKRRHFSSIEITSSTNSTEANLLRWLSLTFSGSPPLSTRNKLISIGILNSRFPTAQYALLTPRTSGLWVQGVTSGDLHALCVHIQQKSICYHQLLRAQHAWCSLHTKSINSLLKHLVLLAALCCALLCSAVCHLLW